MHSGRDVGAHALTMRTVIDTWRGLTSARIKATVAFGVAITLFHVIVWSYGMLQRPSLARPLVATFLTDQFAAFTLMLGIVVADRTAGTDLSRRAAYTAAIIVSALLLAPLGSIAALNIVQPGFTRLDFWNSVVYSFFEWLVLGGAATFIYTDRRRANAAVARMRAAEIERARAAKRTLESRLQAMQARVEPRFLFNALAQVKGLYAVDAISGERMLDELIAYLRAAMPKMRDTSSTVAQELALARAYLAIVDVRLGERLRYEVEPPPPKAYDARMPPMVLLPLLDHALRHDSVDAGAEPSIRIRARIRDHGLRIEIIDAGEAFVPTREGEDLADIRERLSALYGTDAALTLGRRIEGGSEAVLDIRYEVAMPLDEAK